MSGTQKKMAQKVPCQALKDERIKKTLGNGCKFTHANYGTIHQIFMSEFNNPPNIYAGIYQTLSNDKYLCRNLTIHQIFMYAEIYQKLSNDDKYNIPYLYHNLPNPT